MARRAAIHTTRCQLAAWAPWLAELHRLVGGMAAEAAAQLLALKVPAAAVLKAVSDVDAMLSQPADGTTVTSATATTDAADAAATVPTPVDAAPGPEVDAAAAASGPVPASADAAAPAATHTPRSRPGSAQKAGRNGAAAPSAATSTKADTLDNLAQLLTLQVHFHQGAQPRLGLVSHCAACCLRMS